MASNNKHPVPTTEEPVELSRTFEHLLSSAKYSDLSIHGKNQKWDVHRAVVFSRAPFLESLSRKEGSKVPKVVVDLTEHQNAVIDALINWVYRGSYSSSPSESLSWKVSEWPKIDYEQAGYDLRFNTSVFVAATNYRLVELQNLAVERYKEAAKEKWDPEGFCDAAEKLWNKMKDKDGLDYKAVMIETARDKVNELLGCGEFEKLAAARPDVGFAILRAVVAKTVPVSVNGGSVMEDIESSVDQVEPLSPLPPDPVEVDDGWGGFTSSFSSKKDKKKKARKLFSTEEPTVHEVELAF